MTYHAPRPQLRGVVYGGLLDMAVIRYGWFGRRRCLDAPEAHELAKRVVDVLVDAGLVAVPDDEW